MGRSERRKNPRRATGEWGDLAFKCARSVLAEGQEPTGAGEKVVSSDSDGYEAFAALVNSELERLMDGDPEPLA